MRIEVDFPEAIVGILVMGSAIIRIHFIRRVFGYLMWIYILFFSTDDDLMDIYIYCIYIYNR